MAVRVIASIYPLSATTRILLRIAKRYEKEGRSKEAEQLRDIIRWRIERNRQEGSKP